MYATFLHDGDAIDHVAAADIAAGDVVVVGDLVLVAKRAIKKDEKGALYRRGVYTMPKATGAGTAIAKGTKVYWDGTNHVVTATAGALKQAGYVVRAGADADATVDVVLVQP